MLVWFSPWSSDEAPWPWPTPSRLLCELPTWPPVRHVSPWITRPVKFEMESTNHLQRCRRRREPKQTGLTRCPRRRDMRTVWEADSPRLGAATAGGCALSNHFSAVGPAGTWTTSFSTPKGRKRLAFRRRRKKGGGRIYALDTTTFVSLSSKLQGTLRFLQPSQGCSPEHLIFCLRQREHLHHMAIVLGERPVLTGGKMRVGNGGTCALDDRFEVLFAVDVSITTAACMTTTTTTTSGQG